MKKILWLILSVIVVLAVFAFVWFVWPGPQIANAMSTLSEIKNQAAVAGPQGPKGDTGPAMDPADPAFKAVVDKAVANQIAQAQSAVQPVPATAGTSVSVVAATCILDSFPENARFGVQLTVKQLTGTDWEFDPSHASRVAGDVTHPELKADVDLSGCPVLVEGRKILNQEHHIWILIPGDKLYLDADGVFRAKEFSAWAYPSNWNMEDFSTAKAPIAGEFVDAKVNNMKANGYSWPIFVHKSDGTTFQFKAGDKVGAILPNNCNFAAPSHLNVTGVYNMSNKTFDASIGGEGCWVAAEVDGKWQYWQGAKDNIVFTTIDAWLMPSTFTEQNVIDWIAKQ